MRTKLILRTASALALAIAAPPGVASEPAAPQARAQASASKPNVIVIVTDDLGWGDVAIYGHSDVKTPNIDALARRGILFTNFYQSSPVCSPSRAAIVTGKASASLGIHYAIGGPAGRRYNNPQYLNPDLPTIYDAFRGAGYTTGHFGKWHLGDTITDAPSIQAAEAAAGAAQASDAKSGDGRERRREARREARRAGLVKQAPAPADYGVDVSGVTNGGGAPLLLGGQRPDRSQSSEAIVRSGIDFIQKAGGKPFFLSLWTLEPHAVLLPTEEQMAPYLNLTNAQVRERGWRSSQTVYYAALANIDRQLGLLFDHLDKTGLAKNTIVVFTSDNGPSPLWSSATGHAGAGLAGPFRGVKGSLYEGGIRVPFIVAWPGHTPVNVVDDTSVIGGIDLLPTLAKMAGVSAPLAGVDGEDRSAAIAGKPAARTAPLFWDYRFGSWGRYIDKSPRLAVRDGDWKLLMNPDGTRTELYNITRDPSETANIASAEPRRVATLKAELTRWYETKVTDRANAPATTGSNAYPWPKSGSAPQASRVRAQREETK